MATVPIIPQTVYTISSSREANEYCTNCGTYVYPGEEILWGSRVHKDTFHRIHKTCVVLFAQTRREFIA